jgi:hypothetical protein
VDNGRRGQGVEALMRFLKIAFYAILVWYLMWFMPFQNVESDFVNNEIGFDLFRYLTAADMFHNGGMIHQELLNNPLPVIWTSVLLNGGLLGVVVIQAGIFAICVNRLVHAGAIHGIPSWLFILFATNPSVVMYVCMPSKEFFVLIAMITAMEFVLSEQYKRRVFLYIFVFGFQIIAIIVRPAILLNLLALWLVFRPTSRYNLHIIVIALTVLILLPKDFQHYQALNLENISASNLMQAFRELCSKDSLLVQVFVSPLRLIFYIIYPFPVLSVWPYVTRTQDLDTIIYYRIQFAESLGFIWSVVTLYIIRQHKKLITTWDCRTKSIIKRIADYYLLSLIFLAITSPFPHARYRVVALLGLPFFVYRLYDWSTKRLVAFRRSSLLYPP